MKQRQLEGVGVGGDSQQIGGPVHRPHQQGQNGQGHCCSDQVEQNMRGSQTTTGVVTADGTNDRSDGGSQVGAHSHRQGVAVE